MLAKEEGTRLNIEAGEKTKYLKCSPTSQP